MSDYREDETCRRFVLPALDSRGAGWTDDQICPEYPIADGRIRATSRGHRQDHPLRADYALEYRPGLPIGVIEAKRTRLDAARGIEQAKRYALKLDIPFAYATNGSTIYEIDLATGHIDEVTNFPGPDELWRRYCEAKGITDGLQSELVLTPFDNALRNWDNSPKRPRYYQRVAVNRVVNAIGSGKDRILLVLATGTGKTMVAFQIVSKLWRSNWKAGRRPRVLYLADRNVLVDQPKDDYFAPVFGDAVHKLGGGDAKRGRNIYFALYQAMDQGDNDEELYHQFPPNHFDLVIVDECHRGSSRDLSQWRRILEYFEPAVQIGLTATPISKRDADTYDYFGEPIYEYSLAQGIEDGFLAPYRVRKVRMNIDVTGWHPEPGQRDKFGNEIPEGLYGPKEYERVLAIIERTTEAARYLTEYLYETGRMGKTIVFCENNDHANRMRIALNNANADMIQRYPNYVCRITDDDGKPGRVLLDEFRKVDTDEPVIAVTSRLLSTGVDMPTVRNIVLFRRIGSMPEFKQIIGRGTRIFHEKGKLTFDIIDFVEATRLFNDPNFDGPPMRIIRNEIDDQGRIVGTEIEEVDEEQEDNAGTPKSGTTSEKGSRSPNDKVDDPDDIITNARRRLYVDGEDVYVWNETFYVVEGDGRSLRPVEYRQWVGNQVIKLGLDPTDLRAQWARARSRKEISERLEERGITFEDLAKWMNQPEADPIDLLLNAAWELPIISREERARRVRREHRDFLDTFAPEARSLLELILKKYVDHGPEQLSTRVLKVPPFDSMGTPVELAARFGGPPELREALDQLGQYLYDVA